MQDTEQTQKAIWSRPSKLRCVFLVLELFGESADDALHTMQKPFALDTLQQANVRGQQSVLTRALPFM